MPYEFDRYIDGSLMAEGVSIRHAASEAEALEKAKAIYARDARLPDEMLRTTFVLRKSAEKNGMDAKP